MKKANLICMTFLLALSGCASYKPVPEGYAGATATIKDSFAMLGQSKVNFFYLEEVDGHGVQNSRKASLDNSRGMGMHIRPFPIYRAVPVAPQSFTIVARTEYAAPILTMTHEVLQVKGVVQMTPEAGKIYVVRGKLKSDHAEVWLEEESTHAVVGDKIQSLGSPKLGFFEK
ncbi:MAG: hypothetical protein EOP38_13150 [Rubrivivax sp.]|nr:MAG: hypothetical protein EOP38_13150 [Rubrivivax sp.]